MQNPFDILQNARPLIAKGNYKEALKMLNHAEQLALKNKRDDALAAIYGTIGNLLVQFNLEDARNYLEKALKLSEQLASTDLRYEVWVAGTQNNLGAVLHDMGRFEEAKTSYEKALKIRKE